jgi:DNA-binding MarR family transcriptional regulator
MRRHAELRAPDRACCDALSELTDALRTIQVAQGDHPWLLLELTMVQCKSLILLALSGGLRTRELADRLGIAPSATTPLVDQLVERRLARRQHDPGDRRIVWIRPTAKATAIHAKLMRTRTSVIAEVMNEVPPAQRAAVHRSVVLLLAGAERVLARRTPAPSVQSSRPRTTRPARRRSVVGGSTRP